MKQADIAQTAAELGVPIEPARVPMLAGYARLLLERGVPAGIVAEGDRERIWERHILDSLRAGAFVGQARTALDLGSGGGLPGIPLAISSEQLQVGLVERRRSRVAFLELAIAELGIGNAEAIPAGTEQLERSVEICTARAFASAEESWTQALRFLRPGGRLIYFGGKGFEGVGELENLRGCEVVASPVLATSGPLVIMTRT